MDQQIKKCVMIIDKELPLGIIANTAAVMGITLGKFMPETVGPTVVDESGKEHLGVITFPVPILSSTKDEIRKIRELLYDPKYTDVLAVDFSDIAQGCKTYDEYIDKVAITKEEKFTYMGLGICGPKKIINKLTGNMPLLR